MSGFSLFVFGQGAGQLGQDVEADQHLFAVEHFGRMGGPVDSDISFFGIDDPDEADLGPDVVVQRPDDVATYEAVTLSGSRHLLHLAAHEFEVSALILGPMDVVEKCLGIEQITQNQRSHRNLGDPSE